VSAKVKLNTIAQSEYWPGVRSKMIESELGTPYWSVITLVVAR